MNKFEHAIKKFIISKTPILNRIKFDRIPVIYNLILWNRNVHKKKKRKILEKKYLNLNINYSFKKPIFIWGCPRSGTTLLHHLLSLSPQVVTLRAKQKRDFEYNVIEGSRVWTSVFENIREEIKKEITPYSIKKIKKRYLFELKFDRNNKRLLDKIPFMINWVYVVDKIFPDAYHIHMIRNGLAIANSILYIYRFSEKEKHKIYRDRKIPFGPYNQDLLKFFPDYLVQFVARQWVNLVTKGQSWKNLLGDRYIEILYEDLTESPKEILNQICERIEIDNNQINISDFLIQNMNFKYKEANFKSEFFTRNRAIFNEDIQDLKIMKNKMEELGYDFKI